MIFSMIKEKLWAKVMFPIFFIVAFVFSIIIFLGVNSQKSLINQQILSQNRTIAEIIEGSIFDALAKGDNDTVRKQFLRLNEKSDDIKVYVYDFDQTIAFSTENSAIGDKIDNRFLHRIFTTHLRHAVPTGETGIGVQPITKNLNVKEI